MKIEKFGSLLKKSFSAYVVIPAKAFD